MSQLVCQLSEKNGIVYILFRTYVEVVKTNVMHSWMSLVENCFHMKQETII